MDVESLNSTMMGLSLDQIIANKNKQKEADERNAFVNSHQNRAGSWFPREYRSVDSAFTKLSRVPMGKWDHDGYEEMYGSSNSDDRSHRSLSVPVERVVPEKVSILITNLASTVNKADLMELFEAFHLDSVDVHYNKAQEVGVAHVTTDCSSAKEMMKEFKGVILDGKVLKMHLVEKPVFKGISATRKSGIMGRVTFPKFHRPRSLIHTGLDGVAKPYVMANVRGMGYRKSEQMRRCKWRGSALKRTTQKELDDKLD